MEDSGVRDDAGKIRMASRYLCDDALPCSGWLVETVQSRRQGGHPHGRDVGRLQARVQTPVLS